MRAMASQGLDYTHPCHAISAQLHVLLTRNIIFPTNRKLQA